MRNAYKSHVGEVPAFVPRDDSVHIVLWGEEVAAMPTEIFLATSDAAGEVAGRIRASAAVPIPIGRARAQRDGEA